MPDSLLRRILLRLNVVKAPLVGHEDTGAFPSATQALVAEGILKTGPRATEVELNGRLFDVRRTSAGLEGVAREGDYAGVVALADEQILQYHVAVPALVEKLRQECGIGGTSTEAYDGLWGLGHLDVTSRTRIDVYLSMPNSTATALISRCRGLWARGVGSPTAVLTPGIVRLDVAQRGELEAGRIAAIALAPSLLDGALVPLMETVEADKGAGRILLPSRHKTRRAKSKRNGTVAFPTPPGTHWSQVRIRFLDGETVSVRVGRESRVLKHSQMGMADGRNSNPSLRWKLLKAFAKGHGMLTWRSREADRRNQKRKEELTRDLQSFFGIPGDPFKLTSNPKGWKTEFQIEDDS